METLFEELKRYVAWSHDDERALHVLAPHAAPELERIASDFYDRILQHEEAKKALEGGESQVGRLKITLKAWMHSLFEGPWDEVYYERRARIGRVHVRIALPQHYMFGAMDVLHCELKELIERAFGSDGETRRKTSIALTKVLDLELAIMLHTYREDLIAQQSRSERLATFGQLVGSIGHELRNPLGVMESSLYILKGRIGDDERAKKHADRIGDQLQVANHIITDLLDMIRDRPLQRESVNLAALVESVLSVARRPETVSIEVRGFDQLATFRCDGSKLRQVISNLVDNAIHAVGGAGRVLAEATSSSNGIAIAVQDSGPGVAPAMRARLFEPLTTNKVKGIGLGLALVRRIVEQHGGSIAYEPPSEGGARFVVRLPIADTHA